MPDLSITEISEKYNIRAETIRYYERIGLLPPVPRRKNGNRYYADEIQEWVEMIICLRHSGIPVEVLYDYAEMVRQGDDTLDTRKELLKEQELLLVKKQKDLQRSIDRLRHKITLYETGDIKKEKSYFKEYNIAEEITHKRNNSKN